MTTFATGFRQLPDERDKAFPLSSIMGESQTRPVSKAWKVGKVLDQGPTNSCVGHACYQLQVSEPIVRSTPPLSPFDIYGEARKIDEFPGEIDAGTSIRAGLNVLRNHGVIQNYYWAQSAEEVVEYLLRFGPVVLGIRWTASMFSPDANGFIRPMGGHGGGHAIVAYAADLNGECVNLRNSYSEDWGIQGDCLLSLKHLDTLLKEGGVAAAVIEA
jgi:hypothetical protein